MNSDPRQHTSPLPLPPSKYFLWALAGTWCGGSREFAFCSRRDPNPTWQDETWAKKEMAKHDKAQKQEQRLKRAETDFLCSPLPQRQTLTNVKVYVDGVQVGEATDCKVTLEGAPTPAARAKGRFQRIGQTVPEGATRY